VINRKLLKQYFYQSYLLFKHSPLQLDIISLIRTFPEWYQTAQIAPKPMEIPLIWVSYSASKFIGKRIKRNSKVFEWGAGGSTLFFSQKAESVISVEHDAEWASKIRSQINQKSINNCILKLIPTEPFVSEQKERNDYGSVHPKYVKRSFKNYVCAIDQYPDKCFDIIFIDGRCRIPCFQHALNKICDNGFIIFDDYNRVHYLEQFTKLSSAFKVFRRCGPKPYVIDFGYTAFVFSKNG
jgi:hypothetical protein